jgi:hypothetical protein
LPELIGGEWLDADRTPLRLCTVVLTARDRIKVPGFGYIFVADMFVIHAISSFVCKHLEGNHSIPSNDSSFGLSRLLLSLHPKSLWNFSNESDKQLVVACSLRYESMTTRPLHTPVQPHLEVQTMPRQGIYLHLDDVCCVAESSCQNLDSGDRANKRACKQPLFSGSHLQLTCHLSHPHAKRSLN